MADSNQEQNENLVKVWAEVTGFWAEVCSGESMWAEDLGNDLYRLRNSPFYLYGYSFNDIVYAKFDPSIEKRVIQNTHELGGHSTYRIMITENTQTTRFEELLELLDQEHAYFEGVDDKYFAIDVEPQANIQKVLKLLNLGVTEKIWEFEEANLEHDL